MPRHHSGKGTCLEWVPYSPKNQGRMIIAGFDNGIVRWLMLNQDRLFLVKALKVHKTAISHIRLTNDGETIAFVAKNGDIFFLQQHPNDLQKFEPVCLFETQLKINDIQWDKMKEKVLIGCNDGKIYEIQVRQSRPPRAPRWLAFGPFALPAGRVSCRACCPLRPGLPRPPPSRCLTRKAATTARRT